MQQQMMQQSAGGTASGPLQDSYKSLNPHQLAQQHLSYQGYMNHLHQQPPTQPPHADYPGLKLPHDEQQKQMFQYNQHMYNVQQYGQHQMPNPYLQSPPQTPQQQMMYNNQAPHLPDPMQKQFAPMMGAPQKMEQPPQLDGFDQLYRQQQLHPQQLHQQQLQLSRDKALGSAPGLNLN